MSVLFPAAVAVAISTACNWLIGYALTQAFPSILASLYTFGTLYMIGVVNLVAGLFYLFFIPETKASV